MLAVRQKYAPGVCAYDSGVHEIRWDLSGCNLRCLFCWSPASRPSETHDAAVSLSPNDIAVRTLRNLSAPSRTFIRFTGGEPTLQWSDIASALAMLRESAPGRRPPVLFQTNGIEIGRGNIALEELAADPNQLYLFEVSLKGTNPEEFALLTGKEPALYQLQLAGYRRLKDFAVQNPNVAVVAVLGVYHSSASGYSKYAFVDPRDGHILFDDESLWDPEFAAAWRGAHLKWVERLRMSPKGVWENVLARCGPQAAGVIRRFPDGVFTNPRGAFPAKPKPAEYVRKIVDARFWPSSLVHALPDWAAPSAMPGNTKAVAAPNPTPEQGTVVAGSIVTLSDGTILKVGTDVSMGTPVATALLGHKAGETVAVVAPGGTYELIIEKVE